MKIDNFPSLSKWQHCKECDLWKTSRVKVLGRGSFPCDVLCIGEAPGASEIALGEAFVGPAGKLLTKAVGRWSRALRISYVNLVACRPVDGNSNRPPEPEEIQKCARRLEISFYLSLCQGVILLGRMAQQYAMHVVREKLEFSHIRYLPHPAWLLRQGGMDSPDWMKYVAEIQGFMKFIQEGGKNGQSAGEEIKNDSQPSVNHPSTIRQPSKTPRRKIRVRRKIRSK